MTGPRRRGAVRWRAAAFAIVLVGIAVAVPAAVLASRSWTIVSSPDQLTLDQSTAVKLTVTNTSSSGSGIGCVAVTVPADFEISGAAVLSVNGQGGGGLVGWTAVWTGGSTVTFKTTLGLGALDEDESAVFRVTGTASQTGPMSWTATASDDAPLLTPGCGSSDYPSRSLSFTVVGPTPTPTATPAPTAKPTAKPTATPTPRPTQPAIIVLPSIPIPTLPPILPTARPSATPATTPASTPRPTPQPTPRPSPTQPLAPGSTDEPTGPSEPPGRGGGFVFSGNGRPGEPEGFGGFVFDTLNGLPGGLAAWAYPAFVISVPGLLLLLAVGAQALGAFAWLPLIRRRLGEFGLRRAPADS